MKSISLTMNLLVNCKVLESNNNTADTVTKFVDTFI